jgi:hypothetical protein
MSSVNFAIPDFCSLISAQEGEPAGLRRRHQGPEEGGFPLERALDASSASLQIESGPVSAKPSGRKVKAHELLRLSLPGQRSEPFYNGDRNLTKSFGVDLAVGKYSLNLLQTVVPAGPGEQVRSH